MKSTQNLLRRLKRANLKIQQQQKRKKQNAS